MEGGGDTVKVRFPGDEKYAVTAGNSARDREQAQNEQDPVQAEHELERASRIEPGAGRVPAVQDERRTVVTIATPPIHRTTPTTCRARA